MEFEKTKQNEDLEESLQLFKFIKELNIGNVTTENEGLINYIRNERPEYLYLIN